MWIKWQKPAKAALEPKKLPASSLKNGTPTVSKKQQESSDGSDSDSSSDDLDEVGNLMFYFAFSFSLALVYTIIRSFL